jgi:anhydro-N-acetylmuramic acid kinase
MPAFHLGMLGTADEDRAVLNLGGIANLTLIPREGAVRGFDTGPANALMDAWCQRHTGRTFDADGAYAASGAVDESLLAGWRSEPWFDLPPPKSTGREQFHLAWAEAHMGEGQYAAADVQATLLELTVATVADALLAQQPQTRRLLVCGGGVRNRQLMKRLAARLPGVQVESSAVHGLDPEYVEAMGFAWLAQRTMDGLAGNLPGVTGATGPRILGAIHLA